MNKGPRWIRILKNKGNKYRDTAPFNASKCSQGAGVFALPSQRQTGSVSLGSEAGSSLVKAAIVNWGGAKMSPLLLTFSSEGIVKGEQ